MCGRFGLTASGEELAEFLELELENLPQLSPRYNIAPSQRTIVAHSQSPNGIQALLMQWGLIPSWAKEATIGQRLINARAETAAEKPSFRAAFKVNRCIIPADGFYEWSRHGQKKQAYAIALKSRGIFAMAGLFERWCDPQSGHSLQSFTILTTAANDVVKPIHHRMPVILDGVQRREWLSPDTPAQRLQRLLVPYHSQTMETWPVSALVNSPRHDDLRCREPIQLNDLVTSDQLSLFGDTSEP